MTFVSYAQNFEDVMLWRALKHVREGFYVDVGVQDAEEWSVTKALYDAGWRGINIEPIPALFAALPHERPRDINLEMAAGAQDGELELFEVIGTGLSTSDEATARRHALEKGYEYRRVRVQVLPLSRILADHAPGEIHFLKVDVEGMEAEVLRGNDWERFRPWIVVVEATEPLLQQETHTRWEPILLENGYQHVYSDGLNRFYLADEHVELRSTFSIPPNVFDDFRTAIQVRAEQRAQLAEGRLHGLESRLRMMEESRSWRITAPLRWVSARLDSVSYSLGGIVGAGRDSSLHAVKALAHRAVRLVLLSPRLTKLALLGLRPFPSVKQRLRGIAQVPYAPPWHSYRVRVTGELSPRAEHIYLELVRRIEQRQG